MTYPYLTIDLDKIEHNSRTIVSLCAKYGIEVMGVTKVSCGDPEVARAMLRGGVAGIADSRLENIRRLKEAGVESPSFTLLRVPPLSGVDHVVEAVDVSLNSESCVLEGLAQAARRCKRVHDVVIMVDLGDLREGVWPDNLVSFLDEAVTLQGIQIIGLGTNLACLGGLTPNESNMNQLVEWAEIVEKRFGLKLRWISGINSSGLELLAAGGMPERVNHARIGEAIILGCETIRRRPWPDTYQDAFILHAEVLELKQKPSTVVGPRGEDAFGREPVFKDRGMMDRALLNVGREDVDVDTIIPLDSRFTIVGASSGYLVVDVTGGSGSVQVGDELNFSLNYSGLLAAMTSPYVKKRYLRKSDLEKN